MQSYPKIIEESVKSTTQALRIISRLREEDVLDRKNLDSVFMRGRKVNKVPSSSTDIDVTDRVGDFNYDADYFYIVVNDSGAAEWRRATLGTW